MKCRSVYALVGVLVPRGTGKSHATAIKHSIQGVWAPPNMALLPTSALPRVHAAGPRGGGAGGDGQDGARDDRGAQGAAGCWWMIDVV